MHFFSSTKLELDISSVFLIGTCVIRFLKQDDTYTLSQILTI